jgi:hypothetical protein
MPRQELGGPATGAQTRVFQGGELVETRGDQTEADSQAAREPMLTGDTTSTCSRTHISTVAAIEKASHVRS